MCYSVLDGLAVVFKLLFVFVACGVLFFCGGVGFLVFSLCAHLV